MKRWLPWIALSACVGACVRPKNAEVPTAVITVPRTLHAPNPQHDLLDGREWSASYHSSPFADEHGLRVPYTHLQLMADDKTLYVGLYAADQDLRTRPRPGDLRGAVGDRFTLKLGPLTMTFDPKGGHVPPGVVVRTDVDGTIDNSLDDDEEWVIEVAVPIELLGPRAREDGVLLRVVRTDAPKREPERALAWPEHGFALLKFANSGSSR